ncbi:hypothetical protein TNCV_2806561 [Trichonephila clavipes]|nr:hypothetical protein TNCV_2806561 [Trichonephila clavipes]
MCLLERSSQRTAPDWFEVLGYRVIEDKTTDYAHLKQALSEQFPWSETDKSEVRGEDLEVQALMKTIVLIPGIDRRKIGGIPRNKRKKINSTASKDQALKRSKICGSRMEVSGRDNQTRQTRETTRRRNEQAEKPVRSNQTNTRRPLPILIYGAVYKKKTEFLRRSATSKSTAYLAAHSAEEASVWKH